MEKKILINDHHLEASVEINAAKELAGKLNTMLLPAFEWLGIEPNIDKVMDALRGGEMVAQEYHKRLKSDLNKFSIPALKNKFAEEGENTLSEFLAKATECSKLNGNRSILGLKDGQCIVTEEGAKSIYEKHKYFVETPEDQELYEKHVEACQAINAFLEGLPKVQFANFFFVSKEGNIIPNPNIRYDLMNQDKKR